MYNPNGPVMVSMGLATTLNTAKATCISPHTTPNAAQTIVPTHNPKLNKPKLYASSLTETKISQSGLCYILQICYNGNKNIKPHLHNLWTCQDTRSWRKP